MKQTQKVAVLRPVGLDLLVNVLWLENSKEGKTLTKLDFLIQGLATQLNTFARILVETGTLVRYYDEEERKWMDWTPSLGVRGAPGEVGGGWAAPTPQEFEKEYLTRMGVATGETSSSN